MTATYLDWNIAIADVVFPVTDIPEPVYLDLEDDVLEDIGERLDVVSNEVERALCTSVRETLDVGSAKPFRQHTTALWRWSQDRTLDPPPVLAVLAVTSLAAERMSAGDGMSASNFYGRLATLLDVAVADRDRLRAGYQKIAERYWNALNDWLVACGGARGLPTAFSLGHRYVGLPVSQAIVRKADRDRMPDFFQQFGLAPGTELPPASLEPLLEYWMKQQPSPATASLNRLWAQTAARERICQAASVALATWDGRSRRRTHEAGEGAQYSGRLALSLELSGFPVKRFGLGILMYTSEPEVSRPGSLLNGDTAQDVVLAPAVPGALGIGQSASFDATNLLQGVLRIRDSATGTVLQRPPHRLVVFRRDPLTMRFIETPRISMGDDLVVVAEHGLRDRVESVLEACARDGWRRVHGYRGLPEGWDVYEGVELYASPGALVPNRLDDLEALVPLSSSQLRLAGGLPLPGSTRGRWHRSSPPEVRAISDAPDGFTVRLLDLRNQDTGERDQEEEVLLEEWEAEGALVQPLAELELEDGDYRLELVASGGRVLSATHLYLRSSDTPDLAQWSRSQEVSYDVSRPLGVIGVGSTAGFVVRGALSPHAPASRLRRREIPGSPWWATVKSERASVERPVLLTEPDPSSCVYTKAHRIEVDYVEVDRRTGRPLVPLSIERCTVCGISRTVNNDYKANRRAFERKQRAAERQAVQGHTAALSSYEVVQRLSSVTDEGEARSWDLVLDAVMHVGGGPWRYLESLARHIEPTGIFVDQMARALEALGHLDVRRDAATLQPVEWEISPRALVPVGAQHLMVGHWPLCASNVAIEAAQGLGGDAFVHEHEDGPTSWYLDGSGAASAAAAADADVTVVEDAWRGLVGVLPSLGEVLEALPRRSADLSGRLRWFDVPAADWVDVRDLALPGAYRVTGYSTLDVVRGPEDVQAGTAAVCTVYLSKHLAAGLTGRPLMAYDPTARELSVPLGADLPCLYGRAVVLASGVLPERRGRLLVYRHVPDELAHHLAALFTMESR